MIIAKRLFKCIEENCNDSDFVTTLEATQHYLKEHLEKIDCDRSQLQVCQYCIDVFQNYHKLERHHDSVHKNVARTSYRCQIKDVLVQV